MATTQRSFAQSVWDFFCSLKLTISLLISLALTSIIGTILPQGQLPPEYVAQISPLKLQIYSKLGFFDMYHSWWFIALLYVFSLNLIACSIKRLPHVFKFITEPALVLGESLRNSSSLKQEYHVHRSLGYRAGQTRSLPEVGTGCAGNDRGAWRISSFRTKERMVPARCVRRSLEYPCDLRRCHHRLPVRL